MPSRLVSSLLTVALVVSSVTALSACGSPSRSVATYCSYFYGQGGQLREQWIHSSQSASQDPFAALASVFADLPEAAHFLHELSRRAPDDIAPDVQSLSEALSRVSGQAGSAATDPLSALASGLLDGLAVSGAEQHVNSYTLQHCGPPPGSAAAVSQAP